MGDYLSRTCSRHRAPFLSLSLQSVKWPIDKTGNTMLAERSRSALAGIWCGGEAPQGKTETNGAIDCGVKVGTRRNKKYTGERMKLAITKIRDRSDEANAVVAHRHGEGGDEAASDGGRLRDHILPARFITLVGGCVKLRLSY